MSGTPEPERARAWDLILTAAVLPVITKLALEPLMVNHDVGLHLDAGRMILEGGRPYVDFIDTNPPLIMYVSVLPALMARTGAIHIIPAFHIFAFGLMAVSAFGCRRFLNRSGLGIEPHESSLAAAAIILFSFALLWTPFRDWGQREHLYLLLYLPFFYCRWVRWQGGEAGRLISSAAGLAAAVGVCFKPHFVAVAVLVEGAQWAAHRRKAPLFQPEVATFVLGGALYPLHFMFLSGEIRSAFFTRWAPMVMQGYAAYDRPWAAVALQWGPLFAAAGSLVGLLMCRGLEGHRASLARLLALLALSSLGSYLIQQKGWFYHQIPGVFAAFMALAAGWGARRHEKREAAGAAPFPTMRHAAWIATGAVLWSGVLAGAALHRGYEPWRDPGIGGIIRRDSVDGDPILMLSTQVGMIYPLLLQVNRRSASRYITTFPLALLYAPGEAERESYRPRERMGPEEARFLAELGEDIQRTKPPMILIEAPEETQALPPGFTVAGYFEASGFIDGEMAEYRHTRTAFNWDIYVREAASGE
jgi:hypothetical protein